MSIPQSPSAAFDASLGAAAPPPGFGPPLAALWWDARGDWDKAHALVAAQEESRDAAWVHAYLHRKEGDAANARYWYARAGRPVSAARLDDERAAIAAALMAGHGRG